MRRIFALICGLFALCACDKHDPVLPGVRTAIFDTGRVDVLNQDIPKLPDTALTIDNSACRYTQDTDNVIWDGARRVFSGFSTPNTVSGTRRPVCVGDYVIAGLTTGEVVKINPQNRQIMWIADVYRASNLTGGASMVDIIAPVVPHQGAVYAAGLGNAFCKLSLSTGNKQWCVNIGVAVPFTLVGDFVFVVGTDSSLYAIKTSDGAVYWRTAVKSQLTPEYKSGEIVIGDERIEAYTGKIIKS